MIGEPRNDPAVERAMRWCWDAAIAPEVLEVEIEGFLSDANTEVAVGQARTAFCGNALSEGGDVVDVRFFADRHGVGPHGFDKRSAQSFS